MIPYNPSSFNSNKTILEQILELKRWLQAHPSYQIFYSSESGVIVAHTGYLLSAIADPTNLAVGDVVVFSNVTLGVVTSVDTDNGTYGCDACVSFKGDTGATGPEGQSLRVSTDNFIDSATPYSRVNIWPVHGVRNGDAVIFANGYVGNVTSVSGINFYVSSNTISIEGPQGPQGPEGPEGPQGPTGATGPQGVSITNVAIDGNQHLIVTLSDGSTIDAGSIASGLVELEIAYADIGQALSDSDYAICLNADKMIVNYGAGQLIEYTRDIESSTDIKFARTYSSGVDVILVTKATKVVTNPTYKFIAGSIDSQTATSGQVLQADGNGGASWQTPSGGGLNRYTQYISSWSGSDWNLVKNIILNAKNVIVWMTGVGGRLITLQPAYFSASTTTFKLLGTGTFNNGDCLNYRIDLNTSTRSATYYAYTIDTTGTITYTTGTTTDSMTFVYLNDNPIT